MINKWLDRLEEKLNSDYDEYFCGVATTLFTLGYPMDVWCLDCDEDNQKLCKAKAQEIINKIREEWKWYRVELAHEIKLLLENKQAIKEESKQTNTHSDVLNKLLDSMIEACDKDDCGTFSVLNAYDGLGDVDCEGGCAECKKCSIERINKIKQSLEPKQAISDKTSGKKQLREFMEQNKADNVNHPTHYKVHKHECIDEMVAVFGVEAVKCFCKCNAWKYRYRSVAKNGEEDLKKADWYLEKLIELEKGETL